MDFFVDSTPLGLAPFVQLGTNAAVRNASSLSGTQYQTIINLDQSNQDGYLNYSIFDFFDQYGNAGTTKSGIAIPSGSNSGVCNNHPAKTYSCFGWVDVV